MSTRPSDSVEKASSNHFNCQAAAYSLAAAVAGVSMLALAQPAVGEVVVTKKTIPIPLSQLGVEGVGISLTNNGVDDLKLVLSSFSIFGNNGNSLKAVNAAEGEGVVGAASAVFAARLGQGAKIGPSDKFLSAACGGSYFSCSKAPHLAATHTSTFGSRNVNGPWTGNPQSGYLGVRFLINGQTHYGWVRLMVDTAIPRKTKATVVAYAYETTANKPILAGATENAGSVTAELQNDVKNKSVPSLGMLARGADALPLWRREETFTAK